MLKKWLRSVVVSLAVMMPLCAPGAVQAGEQELERLTSYIGNWRGEGRLVGGDRNELFRCRLTVAKGNALKINYNGRCSLANTTLSISGTIAYNDAAEQYEAAMSSNAGYTGLAVGREGGGRISFDLREQQKDRAGKDVRIGAKIELVDEVITVDFEVEFNDSGDILTTSVPFSMS